MLISFIFSTFVTFLVFSYRNISPDPTPSLKFIDIIHFGIIFSLAFIILFAPMIFCYWLITMFTKHVKNKKVSNMARR